MGNSTIDVLPLALTLGVGLVIGAVLLLADRGHRMRRVWAAGGVPVIALAGLGALDLARAEPRETPVLAAVFGAVAPVLGAMAMVRGTRRTRPAFRWPLVVVTASVLLLAGLLAGVTLISRLSG